MTKKINNAQFSVVLFNKTFVAYYSILYCVIN
ncbi:hypothetical protein CLOBL_00160 [Clostridium sp. BL-8]|nr:hypothetical protein CLOBL_00160 [Clostridium sp. BL-8]